MFGFDRVPMGDVPFGASPKGNEREIPCPLFGMRIEIVCERDDVFSKEVYWII